MEQSFWKMLHKQIIYVTQQVLSVKIFFMATITIFYHMRAQPFDWVFVTLVGMLLAFREGKELLAIWKGNSAT